MNRAQTTAVVFGPDDRGDGVREIRSLLVHVGLLPPETAEDDVYDEDVVEAVRRFQQDRGLTVTGQVDSATFRMLDEARWRLGDRVLVHLPGSLMAGDDVVALQRRLLDLGFDVGRVDGLFGPDTEHAVRDFQRNIGVPPDGTCGPATLRALTRLTPRVEGGQPNALRSEERIRRAGPRLAGKIVVLDAAGADTGEPELDRRADDITVDLVRRVEGRLVATGVQAFLTASGSAARIEEAQRADFANRAEADLCVSVHLARHDDPERSGVCTYYYGVDAHGVRSYGGERFAGLVQREIVARTGLADGSSQPRVWDLLRKTRMPTVRVDVGHVTHAPDVARLADAALRDSVAEAIVVAVQRLYLDPDTDPPTGLLRLDEIRQLGEDSA